MLRCWPRVGLTRGCMKRSSRLRWRRSEGHLCCRHRVNEGLAGRKRPIRRTLGRKTRWGYSAAALYDLLNPPSPFQPFRTNLLKGRFVDFQNPKYNSICGPIMDATVLIRIGIPDFIAPGLWQLKLCPERPPRIMGKAVIENHNVAIDYRNLTRPQGLSELRISKNPPNLTKDRKMQVQRIRHLIIIPLPLVRSVALAVVVYQRAHSRSSELLNHQGRSNQ